jgi:hypothetical protein
MNRHLPAVIAALVTSAVIAGAAFMYEGRHVRAVVTTKLEVLQAAVKALEDRVLALERAQK